MKRILEKLAAERQEQEQAFARQLEEIAKKASSDEFPDASQRIKGLILRLEEMLKSGGAPPQGRLKKIFKRVGISADERSALVSQGFHEQAFQILREMEDLLSRHIVLTRDMLGKLAQIAETNSHLADARDREWDALGNNHVGMIFKSMEWRVDKLAAECGDANILMKKFHFLREKLDRLLETLESAKIPQPHDVKDILKPLEDWRYSGFENRFRGCEEEVKRQQAVYLPLYKKGGTVLDLGCGRGEFMEMLLDNGYHAIGVDINSQMVDICRDKGLNIQQGDILEHLLRFEDGSLSGIFSSQVIEHLAPAFLRKLIEACRAKLETGGTIVLETVNPTSVFALVQIYFLDPSHQRPIHPQALKFLLEGAGFEDVEIKYSFPLKAERLQNLPGTDDPSVILNRNIDALNNLLFAPPNYAAVGRKK